MEIVNCSIDPWPEAFGRFRQNKSHPWAIDVWPLTSKLDGGPNHSHLIDKSDSREMVYEWVIENTGQKPEVGLGVFYFKDKEDAITFKMRWG